MKFRPCIDLHSGKVKQIVGSTLTTTKDEAATTNFETNRPAGDFAKMYQRDALTGGHVIMLPSKDGQPDANKEAARQVLQAYPQGMQIGGGIRDTNAQEWMDAGASHIIVTSYVFKNGQINMENLKKLVDIVGKEHLVLDLSCRRKPNSTTTTTDDYYVCTDQWQKFTNVKVNAETLQMLATYCDEFLVHGVDVEGKQCGILEDLVALLGEHSPIPVTYAGGARSMEDMEMVERVGNGKVDLTIGSALDCFGGDLKYEDVVAWHKSRNS
ncbi:5-[(5-phosphoribosylamino)methylideneamino] imidazole-4-carboxamide isomerase, chloroplastic [Seminavis robusta]|uniref:1-(5-phosphoribosyl)-5-[(5-phosphoribosylamino)methylideneamino]imidazole-4-carboxamideisomerase n=1 Tax=Seminavis robusta TaxID=568900 RepID=A0A9N8DD18_9STRA|nr:5-[(5-phosphoribosylamino)methylideneamino] imidazole-4-carboxamide isomerase, chloroplastic [Seminavis robusta]|eukprot:Sro20_g013980.1 5-[(5-phosphoribosylamino)methylideneamino] imidazole-4-carboxamide isomerase, chloroplastic (269) ;mRNA; r:49719-50525